MSEKKEAAIDLKQPAYKRSNNYREGANTFSFTLPSRGPLDDANATRPSDRRALEKRKRVVTFLEPSEAIINDSLELASPWERSGQIVFMSVAQGFQLRLCILAIDDQPLCFDDLEGDKLQAHFTEYERSFLMKALEKISTPPDREVDELLKSMRRP